MARTADHDQRRYQVAEALLTVVARDGFGGASLAAIAAEADVSIGLVQRYFRTKADLLEFGFALIYERAADRMRALDPALPLREALLAFLDVLLPHDAARRAETALWLGFLSAAMTEPRLMARHTAAAAQLVAVLRDGISRGQRQGLLPATLDAEAEARLLTALTDGLTIAVQADPAATTPAQARAILRRAIDHLGFPTAGTAPTEAGPTWISPRSAP